MPAASFACASVPCPCAERRAAALALLVVHQKYYSSHANTHTHAPTCSLAPTLMILSYCGRSTCDQGDGGDDDDDVPEYEGDGEEDLSSYSSDGYSSDLDAPGWAGMEQAQQVCRLFLFICVRMCLFMRVCVRICVCLYLCVCLCVYMCVRLSLGRWV